MNSCRTRHCFCKAMIAAVSMIVSPWALAQGTALPQTQSDPVVGKWRWFNKEIKILHPDGTAVGEGMHGTWTRIGSGTPPKYEFNWGTKWTDTLRLVRGGKELKGENQNGMEVTARRMSN